MTEKQFISRRNFFKRSASAGAAALCLPQLVPASALGANGAVAPSERVTLGCIGVGWMGTSNLESFLEQQDAQVVALCDLDDDHLAHAKSLVDRHYGNSDCRTYHDFRELLARRDIDAVSLGLPDHWHAIPAIAAAQAGKDIYGEKPLSHSLAEGRAMCDAVARHNRIWQTGSWQRSEYRFRFACELVRNGRIGKVKHVEVGLPAGHTDFAGTKGQEQITPPPPQLDYDFWLGPAPYAPYAKARVHKNWRWILDYGGGQLLDWVGHHVDIAHWGMGFDTSSPVEVEGEGEYPSTGLYNTATRYRLLTRYADGLTMIIAGGHDDIRGGTKWIGEHGWIWVTRGAMDAEPKKLLREKIGPEEIHLYRSPGHWRNFLDCVKSRARTITPCEVAHHSATPGHLGQIAMQLGRKIRFDPEKEQIIGDPTASMMLGNAMRSPWRLP